MAITYSKFRTLTRTLVLINKELNQFQFLLNFITKIRIFLLRLVLLLKVVVKSKMIKACLFVLLSRFVLRRGAGQHQITKELLLKKQ